MILFLSWFYVTSITFNLAALTLKAGVQQVIRKKAEKLAQKK
jgi:hypothetical protein